MSLWGLLSELAEDGGVCDCKTHMDVYICDLCAGGVFACVSVLS